MNTDMAPVHLVGGQRFENIHPQQIVVLNSGRIVGRQDDGVAGIEHAAGHVGTFEVAPHAQELKDIVAAHGAGEQSDNTLPAPDDALQQIITLATVEMLWQLGSGIQIQLVDPLPRFPRQHFAEGAGVFARHRDADQDRRRIALVLDQETHHRGLAGLVVMFVERLSSPTTLSSASQPNVTSRGMSITSR